MSRDDDAARCLRCGGALIEGLNTDFRSEACEQEAHEELVELQAEEEREQASASADDAYTHRCIARGY